MLARIYRPSRTAMQSGQRHTRRWVLEFEPEEQKRVEPLMGWTSSGDMRGQLRLTFDTREEAVAYAQRNNIPHQVIDERPRRRKLKTYAENFAHNRLEPWTH